MCASLEPRADDLGVRDQEQRPEAKATSGARGRKRRHVVRVKSLKAAGPVTGAIARKCCGPSSVPSAVCVSCTETLLAIIEFATGVVQWELPRLPSTHAALLGFHLLCTPCHRKASERVNLSALPPVLHGGYTVYKLRGFPLSRSVTIPCNARDRQRRSGVPSGHQF
ncbi:hypothetical protein MTO96_033904 [Rhipicephalus appendiculatus]